MELSRIMDLMKGDGFSNPETNAKFLEYVQDKQEKKMSVHKISHANVTEFISLLVGIGGVYYVDAEHFIKNKKKDENLLILDREEKETPVKVYHNDRIPGDYFVLNLFKETSVPKPEQIWFFSFLEQTMAMHLYLIMWKIIDLTLKDENSDQLIELFKIINLGEKLEVTEKMKKELTSLNYTDIINIFYSVKMKTGEIQSSLEDEEVRKKYKLAKKTWEYISDVFNSIFLGTPDQIHKVFEYKAVTIGAPHCETQIVLAHRFYKMIKPITDILEIDTVDIDAMEEHLRYIEPYQKLSGWDDGIRSRQTKILSPKEIDEVIERVPTLQDRRSAGVPDYTRDSMLPDQNLPIPDLRRSTVPDYGSYSSSRSSLPDYGLQEPNTTIPNYGRPKSRVPQL